jgi:hypothetical protein
MEEHAAEAKALTRALIEARRHFAKVSKDGDNPHLRNRYATLESVLDAVTVPLLDAGLFVTQTPVPLDSGWALKTTIAHVEGGELVGMVPLEYGDAKGLNPMQSLGSAISYARRYGLLSLLCLTAEDDDGATAGHAPVRTQAAPPPRTGNGSAPRPDPTPQQLRERQDAAMKALHDDPPRNGKALFKLVMDLDPSKGLLGAVNAYGKEHRWGPKLVEWSAPNVMEAVRFVREEMEAVAQADRELD